MSHELRTPVSAIVGFLELLAKPELNGGQRKEAIELAGSTAQTLLGLIGNILDIDKIESGKYQVTPQWSDVAQLVSQQCHTFDALAQQKGIDLHYHNALQEGNMLWVDPQALRQILNNLIGNALKFTVEGAIQVSCRLTPANETQESWPSWLATAAAGSVKQSRPPSSTAMPRRARDDSRPAPDWGWSFAKSWLR